MRVEIRRILCPLDFSGSSENALLYAKSFAEAHKAELLLLHVIEPPPYYLASEVGMPVAMLDQHREQSRKNLTAIAEAACKDHPNTRTLLADGSPFLVIVRTAREHEVDLIVMGTHGRTGLAHVLMGSVAEKVVRKAPCPVLTVKHPEHEFVMP
ncbi:MAG: universal stress protein [Lentisphaeria bacterium]|nr:universal stress protein [Lentisphaeria bacterium]